MKARLIFFTLFLTAIKDGFCRPNLITTTCPPEQTIPKCFCSRWLGTLDVDCRGPMKESELESILKALKEYAISDFRLSKYNASSISTDRWNGHYFDALSLNEVEVEDISFSSEGKRHFQGLENSLVTLSISNSFKTVKLLSLPLDHLKELAGAVFTDNNIPRVGNDWFASGPKTLYYLVFRNNGIKELGEKVFASLSRLRELDVSENNINMVSRTMLPKPATILSRLDFSENEISTLPNDIFSGMPALQKVYLDSNRIHTIEEDTWKSVAAQLRTIRLFGNPLNCDEKMKWICNTRFITSIEDHITTCSSPPESKRWTLQKFCGKEE